MCGSWAGRRLESEDTKTEKSQVHMMGWSKDLLQQVAIAFAGNKKGFTFGLYMLDICLCQTYIHLLSTCAIRCVRPVVASLVGFVCPSFSLLVRLS